MELSDRHKAQAHLQQITPSGQQRLYEAKVLIVGVGALGSAAAEALCRAGVRNITLFDYDIIEESNLQRQSLYTTEDVGRFKVEVAKERLIAIDPMCLVEVHAAAFSGDVALSDFNLIIDGTDSLQARLLLNDAAKQAGIPLVIGTASGTTGMLFVARDDVCWQCITHGKKASDDCDTGVLGTVTHVLANMQATVAMQVLLGATGKELIEIDLWSMEMRKVDVKRNISCAACRGEYQYLNAPFALRFCSSREKLIAIPNVPSVVDLEEIREGHDILRDYGTSIVVTLGEGNVLLHRHGAMEFHNVNENDAKRFAKEILK